MLKKSAIRYFSGEHLKVNITFVLFSEITGGQKEKFEGVKDTFGRLHKVF